MKILYFSIIKEKLKRSEEEIEFKGSVRELRVMLMERYPDIKELLSQVKFAVNEEYVSDDYVLEGSERVAIIPPVSGG
ncbi:MAG: molybdopterin converting factor subunit 1 [Hydrogenobacter thermophilus]|uniref:molybdopterin converting factor subunit 1 n=1 Tax=Hydrogenobacter thermophilus TaxID=940 RepID=UPI000CBA681C|nr:molybdopterin converting factor subunit 1 [Hydrogenobacter thermophilus]QWK18909.1 MAG: molybdopterin converting factor subunit 1 [Hydrogenobacter thermophilus]GBC88643.1 Molybdopterin synthase sulfur carrier subunit [bacterium HR13]